MKLAAGTEPPTAYCRYAMQRLQRELSFEKAWWSLHSVCGDTVSLATLNLDGAALAQEYPAIARHDPLHELGFRCANQTVSFDAADLDQDVPVELRNFINRHDVPKAAVTVKTTKVTGLAQGIGIYRGRRASMFSEPDKRLFGRLCQPMFDGLRAAREADIKQRLFRAWSKANSVARIASTGAILDMEQPFIDGLRANWPGWKGPELPAELQAWLEGSPTRGSLRKQSVQIARMQEGDHTLLVMRYLDKLSQLTPRQFQIAKLFAQGYSTKAIAQSLSKEIDTIKNHRKNIYRALDVGSNNDLTHLFHEADPLRLSL